MKLYREKEKIFFSKEEDLIFQFQKKSTKEIIKIVVLEGGEKTDEILPKK